MPVADLAAIALKTGSVDFLLREAMARLAQAKNAAPVVAVPPEAIVADLRAMDVDEETAAAEESAGFAPTAEATPSPGPPAEQPPAEATLPREAVADPPPSEAPQLPAQLRRQSKSRKSFTRKSLDPLELKKILGPTHSPLGRAARAGAAANPKSAILALQGEGPETLLRVVTSEGALACTVLTDGTVLGSDNSLLAYIEADGSVGTATMDYMGEVNLGTGWVTDADEVGLARLDFGHCTVKVLPAGAEMGGGEADARPDGARRI